MPYGIQKGPRALYTCACSTVCTCTVSSMAAESSSSKVFTLGPAASYYAEDLLIKRKYKEKHEESLVKWVLANPDGAAGGDGKEEYDDEFSEKMCKHYLMWMRNEEVAACCPNLMSLQRAHGGSAVHQKLRASSLRGRSGKGKGKGAKGGSAAATQDRETGEESVTEMIEDIKSLVSRAKRIIDKARESGGKGRVKLGKAGTKMLASTMNILSAYAQVGAVANTFRESGALDLLLDLLTSEDGGIRRSASEVLRSLATFDAGSRAYVLLKLTKGDGTGEDQSTSQSRQMLLDLFSDTASVNESDVVLSSTSLPQVRHMLLTHRTCFTFKNNTILKLPQYTYTPVLKAGCPVS